MAAVVSDLDDLNDRFVSLAEAITKTIADHPENDCILIAYVLLRMGSNTAGFNALPFDAVLPIVMQAYRDGHAKHIAPTAH